MRATKARAGRAAYELRAAQSLFVVWTLYLVNSGQLGLVRRTCTASDQRSVYPAGLLCVRPTPNIHFLW